MKTRREKKISESIRRLELQICVVLYISLKHEGANKVHLIKMNNKNRCSSWGWQHSWVHATLRRLPLLSSHLHPCTFPKNHIILHEKRDPTQICCFLQLKWNCHFISSHKTTQVHCISASANHSWNHDLHLLSIKRRGPFIYDRLEGGGSFAKFSSFAKEVLFCLSNTFFPFTIFGFSCSGIWVYFWFFIALLSGAEWGKNTTNIFKCYLPAWKNSASWYWRRINFPPKTLPVVLKQCISQL